MKIICKVVSLRKLKTAKTAIYNDWESYDGQSGQDERFEYASFLQITDVPKKDQVPTVFKQERIIEVPQTRHVQYIHFLHVTYMYYQDHKRVHLLNPITKI